MSRLVPPGNLCSRITHARRTFYSARSISSTAVSTDHSAREDLRTLLQHTAQPVSVLTVKCSSGDEPYHGATLSSFSSIAFHPFPIVSFALQLPSRSANALQSHLTHVSILSEVDNEKSTSNLVINILSASQSNTAIRFSRPDLYPKPFSDFERSYTLTREGIPLLGGSLGALSCSLLASLPLREAKDRMKLARAIDNSAPVKNNRLSPSSSMLYLARVLRIENLRHVGVVPGADGKIEDRSWPLPLVYHRRSYGTVKHLEQA